MLKADVATNKQHIPTTKLEKGKRIKDFIELFLAFELNKTEG